MATNRPSEKRSPRVEGDQPSRGSAPEPRSRGPVTALTRQRRAQQIIASLRRREGVPGADLRSMWFCFWNLSGIDLRHVDFRSANLSHANLRGSDLRGADLRFATLVGANLRAAQLEGATLSDALVKGADCTAVVGLSVQQLEILRRGGALVD